MAYPEFTNDVVVVSKAVEQAAKDFLTIPLVKAVKSEMQVSAVVTVTVPYNSWQNEAHDVVYDMEKSLYDRFPGVLFDFRVKYDFADEKVEG